MRSRILVTGGSGVLGAVTIPLLRRAGHELDAPRHAELDLFDSAAVADRIAGCDALFHLATRIPPREQLADPEAWRENDRIRVDGTRALVDAALAASLKRVVYSSLAFIYPSTGEADESTPPADDMPDEARATLDAEREVARFAEAGGAGVVLRLGLLYGPGTGSPEPIPYYARYGATLHIEDAGTALAAAVDLPSGIYNAVDADQRVDTQLLRSASGWVPTH
jgi:nucleoside-diphosphate-sugar epimerase